MADQHVHVWKKNPDGTMDYGPKKQPIKAGDKIHILEQFTPEERAVVEQMRSLGPTKYHRRRAELLKVMATAADASATTLEMIDETPWVCPELTATKSAYGIAPWIALMLAILAMTFAAALNHSPHPAPAATVQKGAVMAAEDAKPATRTRKGR